MIAEYTALQKVLRTSRIAKYKINITYKLTFKNLVVQNIPRDFNILKFCQQCGSLTG
jgi:hypothetical protein